MAAPKKEINRAGLELDYRAGIKTMRVMASEYGLSAPRITQIAEEEGWERDLTAKIHMKAQAKLNKAMLNANLNNSPDVKVTEQRIIEVAAQNQADIVIAHRSQIGTARKLVDDLIAELTHQTNCKELYEKLEELLNGESDIEGLAKIYKSVTGLSGRVGNLKALTEAMKNLVSLERQAFNIDAMEEKQPEKEDVPITEIARRMLFLLNAGVAAMEMKNG